MFKLSRFKLNKHQIIKKIWLLFSILSLFFVGSIVMAQGIPEAFVVKVDPSSFGVNENVDLTIKAILNNGETVKDYDGDVFIEVDGIIDPDSYIVPSDGLYTFLPQDQGVKLFSKWLNIKKPGTYTILVSDIIDESIQWETTVIVWDKEDTKLKDVSMITPIMWSVQTTEPIDVLAKVEELPNTSYQIYINQIKVAEWTSNGQWDISNYVSGSVQWQNTLQIKMLNIDGEIIWESPDINYTYQSSTDSIFQKIDLLPGINTKQGDKLTFNVKTSDEVSSVELRLSDGQSLAMDRITAGNFSKQVLMETEWSFSVSLSIMVAGNRKIYTDVAMYNVQENIGIGPIKFFTTWVDKTRVNVAWDTIGQAAQYKIDYGLNKSNLDQSQNVVSNKVLIENLDPKRIYYLRISPLDSNGSLIWTPSDIQELQPGNLWAEGGVSCVVNGISVITEKIWGKYYLSRDPVENAQSYIVYRSEFANTAISDMQKIWESSDTKFEYPFNKLSETDQYAYYAVQAVCSDGVGVLIDNVKKVHVGPTDNLLLFVAIVMLFYVWYRLFREAKY